jgi:SHS2 domain-containing protein
MDFGSIMPYEEIHHTADWSLRVWASDLPGLFAESARGMSALSGLRLSPGLKVNRTIVTVGPDPESLLVGFLSELIFIGEQEKLAFDEFNLRIVADRLTAEIAGAPILSMDKAIKAVTYHNLQIRQTLEGCEVEIVFDV